MYFFRFSLVKRLGHVVEKSLFQFQQYLSYPENTYTLISTSTPLGNSSFIKASMVLEEEL